MGRSSSPPPSPSLPAAARSGQSGEWSCVTGYDDDCFVVNEARVAGSVILLPRLRLLWNATAPDQMTVDSLRVVTLIKPPIGERNRGFCRTGRSSPVESWSVSEYAAALPSAEVLILGTGASMVVPSPEVLGYFQSQGVAVEFMRTVDACATFNFLMEEQRPVAAALLTILPVQHPVSTAGCVMVMHTYGYRQPRCVR